MKEWFKGRRCGHCKRVISLAAARDSLGSQWFHAACLNVVAENEIRRRLAATRDKGPAAAQPDRHRLIELYAARAAAELPLFAGSPKRATLDD